MEHIYIATRFPTDKGVLHEIETMDKIRGYYWVICPNECRILVCHADVVGQLNCPTEVIERADRIVCCYPARVAARYPWLHERIPEQLIAWDSVIRAGLVTSAKDETASLYVSWGR